MGFPTIKPRDGAATFWPDELYVVPKGVEHCPVAVVETHLLLIEPKGTPNTGDERTTVRKVEG